MFPSQLLLQKYQLPFNFAPLISTVIYIFVYLKYSLRFYRKSFVSAFYPSGAHRHIRNDKRFHSVAPERCLPVV